MEVLSVQSFCDALTRCHDNQHYNVCIAFHSTVTYIPFINELRRCYSGTSIPGVETVDIRNNNARIMFENGSCVEMFIVNESQRGRRCNEMLCDGLFNEDIQRTVLSRILVPYKNLKDSTEEYFDDSEELDEFLHGFKIVDKVGGA